MSVFSHLLLLLLLYTYKIVVFKHGILEFFSVIFSFVSLINGSTESYVVLKLKKNYHIAFDFTVELYSFCVLFSWLL